MCNLRSDQPGVLYRATGDSVRTQKRFGTNSGHRSHIFPRPHPVHSILLLLLLLLLPLLLHALLLPPLPEESCSLCTSLGYFWSFVLLAV